MRDVIMVSSGRRRRSIRKNHRSACSYPPSHQRDRLPRFERDWTAAECRHSPPAGLPLECSIHATDCPPGRRPSRSARNARVARFARLRAAVGRTGARGPAAARPRRPRPPSGPQAALHGQHALRQHDPDARTDARAGQQRDRAPHQEPRPLERDGHGRQGEPPVGRHRRPHLDLCLVGHALRSGLQPLLPRQGSRGRRRLRLLPGARLAGHVCPRVPRGPAHRAAARRTSAAS